MYDPRHDIPLAAALSLAVSLIATVVAADNTLNPARFIDGALASPPEIVDCELNDGTATTCYRIVTVGVPADAAVGPFCPDSINTTPAASGIWLDGSGTVYDADGDFIVALPEIYDDENWQLFDRATGKVRVTDTQQACEAAARPDVDPAYQNYCVQCSLDYIGGGMSKTYLIPAQPVAASTHERVGRLVGVTLNGIELAAPAPVDAILGNYTIAAFDDCGGHVNPHEGYHYHAATGCTESTPEEDGHAALIGYALDGYGIYGLLDREGVEPVNLDQCRGTTDEIRGYHYHAASAGENMFIGCFSGKTVDTGDDAGGLPGGMPPPDGEQSPPPPRQ